MFCKECGKLIDEDSKFCRYCGAEQIPSAHISHHKVEIAGNVNAQIHAPQFPSISKFIKLHTNLVITYAVWFVVNLILLISGNGAKGFFPRIYKEYAWRHEYTMPRTQSGYEKYSWAIEWEIKNYGWTEFVTYIILVPLVIYIIYRIYKKYEDYQMKKTNGLPPLTPPKF